MQTTSRTRRNDFTTLILLLFHSFSEQNAFHPRNSRTVSFERVPWARAVFFFICSALPLWCVVCRREHEQWNSLSWESDTSKRMLCICAMCAECCYRFAKSIEIRRASFLPFPSIELGDEAAVVQFQVDHWRKQFIRALSLLLFCRSIAFAQRKTKIYCKLESLVQSDEVV